MRRLLLHLSTGVVAFALGVATALIFGVFSFTRSEGRYAPTVHVEPPQVRACPNAPKFSHELPPLPPLPPAPPVAPPPPPQPALKGTRVVIRRSDGTVEVIETEKRVERKTKGS